MDMICEYDKREIEKLKRFAHFTLDKEKSAECLNQMNENYARILMMASIHSSLMEVERGK